MSIAIHKDKCKGCGALGRNRSRLRRAGAMVFGSDQWRTYRTSDGREGEKQDMSVSEP